MTPERRAELLDLAKNATSPPWVWPRTAIPELVAALEAAEAREKALQERLDLGYQGYRNVLQRRNSLEITPERLTRYREWAMDQVIEKLEAAEAREKQLREALEQTITNIEQLPLIITGPQQYVGYVISVLDSVLSCVRAALATTMEGK